MEFEVTVPARIHAFVLGSAGLEVEKYLDVTCDAKFITGKMPPPTNMPLPYFLSDAEVVVRVSLLKRDRSAAILRVAVSDDTIGKRIRDHMTRYSIENDGLALNDREHAELWVQINEILETGGTDYYGLQRREAELTRPLMEKLIKLCDRTQWWRKSNIWNLFLYAAKPDKEFACRWLISQFETVQSAQQGDLSLRIWDTAVPAVGDDIIRLLTKRPFRGDCGLPMALAKTKHPRAAEVIASVIHEKNMAWSCIQALAKLNAKQHAPLIQEFLEDPDSDVRRQAKKALKKFGLSTDTPPPPKHLFKGRRVPSVLEEWSANLDMDDLEPALKKLSSLVATGFDGSEVREVLEVVEDMQPEQTKAFCFEIEFQKKCSDLYVVVFMDDVDAPDLAIHSTPELIQRFGKIFTRSE